MGSPFPCFANKFLKYPSPSLVSRKSPFPLHCPCAPETNSIQREVLAPTPKGSREQFDWSLLPVFLKATSYLQEPIPTWGYHLSGRMPDMTATSVPSLGCQGSSCQYQPDPEAGVRKTTILGIQGKTTLSDLKMISFFERDPPGHPTGPDPRRAGRGVLEEGNCLQRSQGSCFTEEEKKIGR